MIPIGQAYAPSGGLHPRGILTALILGGWVAAVGAGALWLWESYGLPTLFIITPLIQGACVGLVLNFVFGRMKVRNPGLARAVGFACGLAGVILVHYFHYIGFVYDVRGVLREELRAAVKVPEGVRNAELDKLERRPFGVVDEQFLLPETGRRGFPGWMVYRSRLGVKVRRADLTGVAAWMIWGLEGVLAGIAAAAIAKSRTEQPFCEDCGRWCEPRHSPNLVLPGEYAEPLAAAVRGDDPIGVLALKAEPPPPRGPALAVADLMACPGCDQTFADVALKVAVEKGTHVTGLVQRLRISPAMAVALLADPAELFPPPGPDGDDPGADGSSS